MRSTRTSRRAGTVVLLASLSLAAAVMTPLALAAPDYTWSGEDSAAADGWSNGANWQGGSAPSASSAIGTLSFPTLGRSSCFAAAPAEACFVSTNDLTGLSVEQLSLDDADDHYTLGGDGFSLGSGGLVTTNFAGSGGFAVVTAPIELSASQTWNVSSGPGGGDGLSINGALSGSTANLTVQLRDAGYFNLGGFATNATDNEVGNVIVEAEASERGLPFILDDDLNDHDGQSLTVRNVQFNAPDVSIGPLISEGSIVELGSYVPATVTWLDTGGASFDTESELRLNLGEHGGTEAGVDYSQLRATGNVELGDATFRLVGNNCPDPPAGQVITLITSTGSLSGTFSNAPNGSTVTALCGFGPKYHITYNASSEPQTVTATATGETEYTEPPKETSTGSEPPPTKETHETTTTSTATTNEPGDSHSTTTTTTTNTAPAITTAQIKAALAGVLAAPHNAGATLLKHGSLTLSARAPEAGTLQVQWFEQPSGAKAASTGKARSVLIATGTVTFSGAGSQVLRLRLSAEGRKLLKRGKRLRAEVRATFRPSGGGTVGEMKRFSIKP